MALIACPECKTQVSAAAASCPKCGYPIAARAAEGAVVTTQQTAKLYKGLQAAGVVTVAIGVVVLYSSPSPGGGIIAFVGIVLYLYGRIAAWWRHG